MDSYLARHKIYLLGVSRLSAAALVQSLFVVTPSTPVSAPRSLLLGPFLLRNRAPAKEELLHKFGSKAREWDITTDGLLINMHVQLISAFEGLASNETLEAVRIIRT